MSYCNSRTHTESPVKIYLTTTNLNKAKLSTSLINHDYTPPTNRKTMYQSISCSFHKIYKSRAEKWPGRFDQTKCGRCDLHENGISEAVANHEMRELGGGLRHLGRRPHAVGAIDMGRRYARKQRQWSQHHAAQQRSPVVPPRSRSRRDGRRELLVGHAGGVLLALEEVHWHGSHGLI